MSNYFMSIRFHMFQVQGYVKQRGIPIIYLRSHATDAGYGLPGDVFDDFDLQAVAAASIAQAQSEPLRLSFFGGENIWKSGKSMVSIHENPLGISHLSCDI